MVDHDLVERITKEVMRQLGGNTDSAQSASVRTSNVDTIRTSRNIPVGVSARHIHLCEEHLFALFGPGAKLNPIRDLPDPREFAAEERVTLVGPRLRAIENVRVLGPLRSFTQVEISRTDARILGMNPPVRQSGNLRDTPGVTIIGPAGTVVLEEGVIIANRHIHLTPEDASFFGVHDNDEVDVRVISQKPTILGRVQIRISPKFVLYMHLDTDDANACAIDESAAVEILKPEVSKCCWE